MEKICNKCGILKKLREFPRLVSGYGDGHHGTCGSCRSEYKKAWYRKNSDRIKNVQKVYSENHKEYYRQNIRRWKSKNRDHVNEKGREWSKSNPLCGRATASRRRARKRTTCDGTATTSAIKNMLISQGNRCKFCNIEICPDNAHLDHIMPLSKGGKHTISNLQWLCCTCNLRKSNKIIDSYDQL